MTGRAPVGGASAGRSAGRASEARATDAAQEFLTKSGHHDTTVLEKVAPAVVHETIEPTQHEDVQTVIDKEIHQDHYHTSVQPIADKVILPEQHTHNLVAVEERSVEHGDKRDVEARLAAEAGKFQNERIVTAAEHTHSVAPVIAGEHIHHHVHETIQPVVQREIIQPSVVHTTVPIHEVHHNAAQHHTTSALPAVSMSDFKKQGGVLSGREERYDGFEGEPKSVGGSLGGGVDTYTTNNSANLVDRANVTKETRRDASGSHTIIGERGMTGTSDTAAGMYGDPSGSTGSRATMSDRMNPMTGTEKDATGTRRDVGSRTGATGTSGMSSSSNTGMTSSSNTGMSGSSRMQQAESDLTGRNASGSGVGHNTSESTGGSSTKAKPSLLDKLNPFTDSDGDGAAGFMK